MEELKKNNNVEELNDDELENAAGGRGESSGRGGSTSGGRVVSGDASDEEIANEQNNQNV